MLASHQNYNNFNIVRDITIDLHRKMANTIFDNSPAIYEVKDH
jgi:hypothetical protein